MADPLPPILLATAIEAVIRAGDVQMAGFRQGLAVEKKGAIDLVTEIDRAVEREFRALIDRRFPRHVVIGEEFATAAEREVVPEYGWVFDPLDGTTNYAHGLPIFCSSLALEIDGVPMVGAVYDPTRRELFTAERDRGAWLNGTRLHVSSARSLIDSLLCTGFPYTVQQDPAPLVGLFAEFLKVSRAVRRLGSAAVDLCYVAAGRLDGFWEQKLNPWDTSAGALIVEEAGGRVSGMGGEAYGSRAGHIVASNGHIHDAMLATIAGRSRRSQNETA